MKKCIHGNDSERCYLCGKTEKPELPLDNIVMLRRMVDESFRMRYGISIDDVEISDVPGYWRV